MLCSKSNSTAQGQPRPFPLSETAPLRILVFMKAVAAHSTIQVRLVEDHEDWRPDLSGDGSLPPCAGAGTVKMGAAAVGLPVHVMPHRSERNLQARKIALQRPTSERRTVRSRQDSHFSAVLAAALLLWSGSGAHALASTDTKADHYITAVWQVEEGLPGNRVTSVVQTPDGYLWVGTQSGLARFDGVRFAVFDGNTPGLESRQIGKLFVDQQGGLWVAMLPGQLARYAAGKFTAFHAADGWSMKLFAFCKIGFHQRKPSTLVSARIGTRSA